MLEAKKTADGIVIPVKVQPGARKNCVVGEWGGRLKLQIAPPPDKGKANEAAVRLLAKCLGVQRSSVQVVSGETSRYKKVLVQGEVSIKDVEDLCQK
ncbi:MAG: YggU family protein [Planctomycetes bacterium]|nr:YggU family protein [Planctomycetota bacterium]